MTKFAVVDVETTGFGKSDRVVEIAVVVLDARDLSVVDEFESLLNPMRDIGAVHVHGITPTMVEAAPTFDEVAPTLTRILGGNVIVAHNLPFDCRFLLQEFSRSGIDVDSGRGICTLKLSGERLDIACERLGIAIDSQHRALTDARATAQLFATLVGETDADPFRVLTDVPATVPRTLRRGTSDMQTLPLSPSRFRVRYPTSDELEMSYLHVLDAYLDDLVLTSDEYRALGEMASIYEIDVDRQQQLHRTYFASLVAAAQRDGVVSKAESDLISSVAAALKLDTPEFSEPSVPTAPTSLIGLRVCFTGKVVLEGRSWDRGDLEALAAANGLQPVASVTKTCDLVVAADPATTSGKAQKARQRGLPVMSAEEFLQRVSAPWGRS